MDSETPVKKILILAANPKQTSRLRLDEEARDIKEGLRLSQQRDKFILQQEWAVRPRDVRRAVLDFRPNIIHFSGHGTETNGLSFEDESGKEKLVTGVALAGLFEQFSKQVECVLLNACYSEDQAVAIAQHIDYVIGMNAAIGDRAALEFAVGFYDALAAYNSQYDGESPVEFAFKIACNAIVLAGVSGESIPIIKKKPSTAQLRWSESGDLTYSQGIIPVKRADLNVYNFIVEAKFYNPYDNTIARWEYGFSFRETTRDFKDPQRQVFDLYINSVNKTAKLTGPSTNLTVNVPNLDVSNNGSNQVRLTVDDNTAILYVNDKYIETFDVSTLKTSGSIYVVSKGMAGYSIRYENFKVWSINE